MPTEQHCFCELAPLYALGTLSESEQQWVEQQVRDCPELAEELDQYQDVLTALPYSPITQTPGASLSGDLKNRLFAQLDLETPPPTRKQNLTEPAPAKIIQEATAAVKTVTAQELTWEAHPVPGVTIATLHIDDLKREIVGLLKAEPGMQYPIHTHVGVEEIYMLTGHLTVGQIVYGAGDYIRSEPGSAHAPYSTDGCTFFFRTSLDDEYPEEASTEPTSLTC